MSNLLSKKIFKFFNKVDYDYRFDFLSKFSLRAKIVSGVSRYMLCTLLTYCINRSPADLSQVLSCCWSCSPPPPLPPPPPSPRKG